MKIEEDMMGKLLLAVVKNDFEMGLNGFAKQSEIC